MLHPEEEQLVSDLGASFSRLVMEEVGRLEGLRAFEVVDKGGGKVLSGVVSQELSDFLEGRGCEVVEGDL